MPKEFLIADANVTAQEEFEKIFEGMDSQLIFAENGEDALLKIKLYKPDLVIADVTMPNKDGFELCKMVKSNPELQQIPFVLLAGIFEEINKSEQDRAGADGVMSKPLKGEEILPLVKDLLETGPVPLKTEVTAEAEGVEARIEETLLGMEGLPTVEGLEEGELSHSEAVPQARLEGGEEDEEAVIDLTEVVEEETSAGVSPGENAVDESLEQVAEGEPDVTSEQEALDEISLEGIDLDEPGGGLELEEIELAEQGRPQEKEEKIEETPTTTIEGSEFGTPEEDRLDQEEREKPSDKALETELEEEIDRRIDLVLEEEQEEEEDTLLELEGEEEEKPTSPEGAEELESLAEGIARAETREAAPTSDESFRDEEETLLELEESEDFEKKAEPDESTEELSVDGLRGTDERTSTEPLSGETLEETFEEAAESSGQVLGAVLDDFEDLSMEDLEGLGEAVEDLEELPVEKELEGLLGEGVNEFEEPGQEGGEERLEEDIGTERLIEVPVEPESQDEEVFEEVSDAERTEQGVDEEQLADLETEGMTEASDLEAVEEAGEEPLEELGEGLLEEGLEGGEDILEEPWEEPAMESVEPFPYPRELIKEEQVSEEEVDAFQKRLSADLEDSESRVDVVVGAPDERIESLVRKAVEQVLNGISESVIPELTRTIAEVTSERIEKVVQQVVPELAESAIKREIERLQKEG